MQQNCNLCDETSFVRFKGLQFLLGVSSEGHKPFFRISGAPWKTERHFPVKHVAQGPGNVCVFSAAVQMVLFMVAIRNLKPLYKNQGWAL